jgi:hypothetical protein
MTEQEWRDCPDPNLMLESLRGKASERKLPLFALVCCRWVSGLLNEPTTYRLHPEAWAAIRALSECADGRIDAAELSSVRDRLPQQQEYPEVPPSEFAWRALRAALGADVWMSARDAAHNVLGYEWATSLGANRDPDPRFEELARASQNAVLRDLFGPLPFRALPVPAAVLAWGGGAVRQLARACYDKRGIGADHPSRYPFLGVLDADMLVLGDALEEAGCTDAEVLEHCRKPGTHVQGCWVVDLLLGKS